MEYYEILIPLALGLFVLKAPEGIFNYKNISRSAVKKAGYLLIVVSILALILKTFG